MRNLKDIIIERLNISNNVIFERLVLSKKGKYPADNWEPLQKNYTTLKAFIAELDRYGTFYLENIYGPDNLPEYTDKRKGKMVINRLVTSYTNELICLSTDDRFPNNISEEDFLENVLGQGDLEKGKAIYQMIYNAMLDNEYK